MIRWLHFTLGALLFLTLTYAHTYTYVSHVSVSITVWFWVCLKPGLPHLLAQKLGKKWYLSVNGRPTISFDRSLLFFLRWGNVQRDTTWKFLIFHSLATIPCVRIRTFTWGYSNARSECVFKSPRWCYSVEEPTTHPKVTENLVLFDLFLAGQHWHSTLAEAKSL